MALYDTLCFLLFGTFLCSLPMLHGCEKQNVCTFPVYPTEFCPRNQTEWDKRSSDMNCNETNSYMCVPNEKFTELLEFCYKHPRMLIVQDPSCVHVKNGCFVAEPSCRRQPPERENQINIKTIAITLGVSIPTCILCILSVYFVIKRKWSLETYEEMLDFDNINSEELVLKLGKFYTEATPNLDQKRFKTRSEWAKSLTWARIDKTRQHSDGNHLKGPCLNNGLQVKNISEKFTLTLSYNLEIFQLA